MAKSQEDGGAEFKAIFGAESQKQDIALFVIPPRLPKLNGGIERAHWTHTYVCLYLFTQKTSL